MNQAGLAENDFRNSWLPYELLLSQFTVPQTAHVEL
jgi:hypothetical protein